MALHRAGNHAIGGVFLAGRFGISFGRGFQREATLHFANQALFSLTLTLLASAASAATITGNVTGPDGKPFMGAFVVAENPRTKMTVSVLSNEQGRYHIGNLPAATYKV